MKRFTFLVLILFVFIGNLCTQTQPTTEQIHAGMQAINRERGAHGLHYLSWNSILSVLARNNNWNMIQYGVSHNAMPKEELAAILSWAEQEGYRIDSVWENIALRPIPESRTGALRPYDQIVNIFRHSPPHYDAILNKDVTITGFYITTEDDQNYITLYMGQIE